MQCAQLTHLTVTRPSDQNLKDQDRSVETGTLPIAQPHSEGNHRERSWRAITYQVLFLPFLFLAALAWTRCDFSGREIPDWKPVLALADAARERGDLYYSKSLYSQAGRLAASREDLGGFLSTPCGMKQLEKKERAYSSTHTPLL